MNELDNLTEIKRRLEILEKRAYFSEKLINDVYTSAPTYTPKTFIEQFAYYETGGVKRLYFYCNNGWNFVVLT